MDITKYDVIKGPVVTNKAYRINHELKQLVIDVHMDANKPLIKEAIEKIFDVKVEKIRTLIRKPRSRKVSRRFIKGSFSKKAIITLKDGYSIDIFGQNNMAERGSDKNNNQVGKE